MTQTDGRQITTDIRTKKKEQKKKTEPGGTHMHRCPSLGRESRVVQVFGSYVCQEAIVAPADTSRPSGNRRSERSSQVMHIESTTKALKSGGHCHRLRPIARAFFSIYLWPAARRARTRSPAPLHWRFDFSSSRMAGYFHNDPGDSSQFLTGSESIDRCHSYTSWNGIHMNLNVD